MSGDNDNVVLRLYQAATDPCLWPAALATLADAMRAEEAALNIWQRQPEIPIFVGTAGRLYGEDVLSLYGAHYGALDPSRRFVTRSTDGEVRSCSDHVSLEVVGRSAYYQDFLIPFGGRYVMGARLNADENIVATVGIHRGVKHDPFSRGEMDRLSIVLPHLRQAAWLYVELSRLRAETARTRRVIDAVGTGIVIVDATGRLQEANAEGRQLLRQAEGIRVRDGRVVASGRVADAALLSRLIAEVAGIGARKSGVDGKRWPGAAALALSRGTDRRPLLVRILPLAADVDGPFQGLTPAACLFITDPETKPAAPGRVLAELFRLTPAEAQLAVELARGADLKEIATARGSAIPTLRTQLAAVLYKTQTRRQSDLIRLLSRLI